MQVFPSKNYKKSLEKILRSGKISIGEIDSVIEMLCSGGIIPQKYKNHTLGGEYLGYKELHIKPDLLLIYQIHGNKLFLVLFDIGSHAKLFK